jgi:hypothetical protein
MDQGSIRAFESYCLGRKQWDKLWCTGDDPWTLAEYFLIPLYGDSRQKADNNDEPHSILLFGGYSDFGTKTASEPANVMEAKFGEDYRICCPPYRNRLLRLVSIG